MNEVNIVNAVSTTEIPFQRTAVSAVHNVLRNMRPAGPPPR